MVGAEIGVGVGVGVGVTTGAGSMVGGGLGGAGMGYPPGPDNKARPSSDSNVIERFLLARR